MRDMKCIKNIFYKILPYGILFLTACCLFFRNIADGDELWNYNFARNICEGRVPYRDFNMLQTPLSAYLAAGVLKMFGNSLVVFRICGIILFFCIFAQLYWICSKIWKEKVMVFVLTTFVLTFSYQVWIYNYNHLNLFLLLLLMCLERKRSYNLKKRVFFDILCGLIAGCFPLVKQSSGAVLWLVHFCLCFLEFWRDSSKRKNCLLKMGVSILPICLFVGILLVKDLWGDFLEYAVFGVRTFTQKVTFMQYFFSSPFAFLKGAFVLATIGISIYTIFRQKEKRNLLIPFLCYAIAGLSVAYPLCDEVHMSVALIPFLPCVMLAINVRQLNGKEKFICGAMACFVLCSLVSTDFIKKDGTKKCELIHFQELYIDKQLEEQIVLVTDYMKEMEKAGQKIAVADEYGLLYSIVLSDCHKDLDMLLLGNVGNKDVKTLLEPYKDTILLVRKKEETLGYQAHKEVVWEIKNKYEKIAEVGNFEVYSKGKKE